MFLFFQQPGIGIAHDYWTSYLAQTLNRLTWLRTSLNRVSQTDNLVDALPPNVLQRPVKREAVAMNIRNNRDLHRNVPLSFSYSHRIYFPSFRKSSPSTHTSPQSLRSHIISQWSADTFNPPDSG